MQVVCGRLGSCSRCNTLLCCCYDRSVQHQECNKVDQVALNMVLDSGNQNRYISMGNLTWTGGTKFRRRTSFVSCHTKIHLLSLSLLAITMVVTQSFRLPGKTDIIEIPCDNVDGQNIVHWVDIEQIFPGVKYVKRGNIAVTFMKEAHLTK